MTALFFPPPDQLGQADVNVGDRNQLLGQIQMLNPNLAEGEDQLLGDIASTLSRFAGNQRTVYDDGGSVASTNGGTNALQSRVRRAWTQVLGRAPGNGSSFIQALNGAFPVGSDGSSVATLPVRSAVSLYNPDSMGATMASATGNYGGQLSVGQAALFRQACVIAADAQKVLAGLTTTSPAADFEQMEAARALISTQITNIVQEFGRVDEPRAARVNAYFAALGVPPVGVFPTTGSLGDFATAAIYTPNLIQWVTTDTDAAQIAGYNLLISYLQNLQRAWSVYAPPNPNAIAPFDPSDPSQLSLRLDRAQILLPSVGQANAFVKQAWASVGFSEADQRSVANRFSRLVASAATPNPPTATSIYATMTPGDLADWIDSFNDDGLSTLSGSGRYGLDFVTDQADSIFWVVGAVIYTAQVENPVGQPSLLQYLDNERVMWSLTNLLTQLDGLADLKIPLPILS